MAKKMTLAKAKRKHGRRPARARKIDNCRVASTVYTKMSDLPKWAKTMNKTDFASIDTPGRLIKTYKRAKPGHKKKTVTVKAHTVKDPRMPCKKLK